LTSMLVDLRYETDPVVIIRTQFACAYVDRLGDCREALRRIIRDERDGSAVALALNAMVASASDDWCTGRWDEAKKLLAEGVALCNRHGYRRHATGLGDYIGALIAAARGDSASSDAAATKFDDAAEVTGSGAATTLAHHVRTVAATTSGDFERAYGEASAISPAGQLARFTPHALWVLFDLVEAALRTDRRDAARDHVDAMRDAGIDKISARLALVHTACTAMTGPADQATATFEKALAIPDATRWQFDYARVQLVYGEHLRSTGSVLESRSPLSTAMHAFEGLRATPWTARAKRALRASGLSSPDLNSLDTPALSEQDWEIAALAASGLTNRQIGERLNMSHRTVGGHLYRIFPLLGITSRAALHEALQAHGRRA
jgi:ATP/maltotriose-dependent transcriptional regulator MalT